MSENVINDILTDHTDKRCPVCHYLWPYCVCEVDGHYPGGNPVMSLREREMLEFGGLLCEHVGDYTVPQYGDKGEDNVTNWSARDCEKQIEKYVKRFATGQRGFESSQQDLMKIAHYACLTYNKRLEERANDEATRSTGG